MRLKSAEYRQEKGQNRSAVAEWVGEFPCRGQEAPQRALGELSKNWPGASRGVGAHNRLDRLVRRTISLLTNASHGWRS